MAVDQGVVKLAIKAAREAGADPLTFLAAGLVESGLRHDAVGDQGTSFGAYQWHRGGALGSHDPAWTRTYDAYLERARAFAAQGKGGAAAAAAQRPADPAGYARKVDAAQEQARRILQGLGMSMPVETNEPGMAGAPELPDAPAELQTTSAQAPGFDKRGFLQSTLDRYAKLTGADPIFLPEPPAPEPVAEPAEPGGRTTPADAAPSGAPGQLVGAKFSTIGGPGQGTHSRTEGPDNWQSDNAVDVSVPVGTPIYASEDGIIGDRYGSLGSGGRFAGLRLNLVGAGNAFYYAHLSKIAPGVKPGSHVQKGQVIGYSGSANGVPHLHFGVQSGDPNRYVG